MKKKYIVRLSAEERHQLTQLVHTGKVAAYRRTHAQILLWADAGEAGPGLLDAAVAARAGGGGEYGGAGASTLCGAGVGGGVYPGSREAGSGVGVWTAPARRTWWR